MQAYSDPSREDDPYSLPDVEIFRARRATILCAHCGDTEVPYETAYCGPVAYCPSCDRPADRRYKEGNSPACFAWWWWTCLPGCLPDSDPIGPFDTEEEAIASAQENAT